MSGFAKRFIALPAREAGDDPISRRGFLTTAVAAGAGLVVGFYLPHGFSVGGSKPFSPNAYLKITPDGKITVMVARSEMGQGVHTSLPMILAEELEANWKQIHIEQVGASTLYGDQTTGGSASVRTTWDPMRRAGAAAREMLISAAALTSGAFQGRSARRRMEASGKPAPTAGLTYGALARPSSHLADSCGLAIKAGKRLQDCGKADSAARFTARRWRAPLFTELTSACRA